MVSGTQSPHEAVSCYSLNLGVAIGAIKQKYHYNDATIERHSSSQKKTWCQYLHPHIIRHVTLRTSPGLPASFLAQNSPQWPQLLLLQMILSASLANQGGPQRICWGISPKQPLLLPQTRNHICKYIYICFFNIYIYMLAPKNPWKEIECWNFPWETWTKGCKHGSWILEYFFSLMVDGVFILFASL